MNRIEFMNELEYLLQDIPEEEKAEAVAYYRDYLEDAGDEHEEQAIRDFGSPERVAAIIRSDLVGNLEDGGSFTESGYQDERFKDPNYQVVEHKSLPDVTEEPMRENGNRKPGQKSQEPSLAVRFLKVGGLLVLLALLAPIILGIGGGAIGILTGIIGILLAIVLLVGVLTVAACIGAVVLLVMGAGMLFAQAWWSGILMIGCGVLVLGLALIGIACSILIYGTFLPFCIRGVIDCISGIIHRGGRRKA